MQTIPGKIKLIGSLPFGFGRVMYKGNYHLGKIHFTPSSLGLYISPQGGGFAKYTTGFEVLACSPVTTTTSTTTVTTSTTNFPCGESDFYKNIFSLMSS
jgi:hypothetical protein